MRSVFTWALFAALSVFSSHLHALSITLDGSRTVLSGTDCEVATYAFGINETWQGQLLDLHVEVLDQDNENTNGDCIAILDGIFTVNLRDKDAGDDIAFADVRMTIVQRGTTTPVFVDRITATGFDLDNVVGTTGTDDIYFTGVEAPYLSDLSDVTYSTGSFGGGHDFKFQGKEDGNCTDTPGTPVPECRAAVSWVGGANNQISSIRARFQNDNAYGTSTNNNALRRLQLSLEVRHAEEVISDTRDRGDAPASYGDAVHPITSLTTLLSNGLAPDNDPSTQYSNGANTDDDDAGNTGNTGIAKYNDEDSVLRNGQPLRDQTLDAGASETFSVLTFGNGYLSAWIDLNIDGDFNDAGEKILDDVFINNDTVATTPVTVDIPQDASGGNTYTRFRFNNNPGLGPSGAGVDGEVEDYRVVIAAMDPTFNMVKSASPTTLTAAGIITYTFQFNNTGNAVLSDLTVNDPDIDTGTLTDCPIATLNPGDSASCTATRTISQAQIDSGATLTNTATTSGTNPLGGPAIETTTADNTVSTPIAPVFTLDIDKQAPINTDADGSGDISAGDTLTYTITATNTSTATVNNLVVSDPMLTPSSSTCASVAPGGTCVLTGTYTVTSNDIGVAINNTATATSDQTAQVSDNVSVTPPQPSLVLVKSTPTNADDDGSTDISAGDTLTYTVTATNNGTATLTNVLVEDVMLSPSTQSCATLAAGQDCVLSGTHVVTAANVSAGSIVNTATANADQTAQVTDTVTVPVPAPALAIDKTAPANVDNDGSGDISSGDVLTYTITATNTGTSVLTNVTVTDPLITPSSTSCASLAAGANCTLTGTYTVSSADVSAGQIDNTAGADSNQTASVSDTETVTVPTPALSLDKQPPTNADNDSSGDVSAGDVLTYSIVASNTGTATLTGVTVNDVLLTPDTTNCATLSAGQTCTLNGAYTVTAADVTAGSISNTATANSDQTTSIDDTEVVTVPSPALSLDKSTPANADNDGSTDVSVGDVLTYTVTATNSGTSVLTNVVVDDPMLTPSTTSCATLAIGATCVLSGTYTVEVGDIANTSITNTATADSDQTTQQSDTEVVPVPTPNLALNKPAPVNADEDGSGDVSAGDTLTYTITATNSGAAILTNVVVSDPLIAPDTINCASLAVGATCVLSGNYSVTSADVSAGTIDNTATADSDQTGSLTAVQNVTIGLPNLAISKPAPANADEDGSGDISVGDTLTYTVTATNSGASNLTNVVVTDPLLTPNSNSCGLLAPGATCALTGTYSVTGTDVSAGIIDNTASAVSDQTPSIDASQSVNPPAPALTLSKPAPANADEDGSGDVSAGDTLTYTITATNTGTATLTNVTINDPLITPNTQVCNSLSAGETCVLSGTYQVTATDVSNGSVVNTASSTSDQTPGPDATQTVVIPDPQHSLDKAAPTNTDNDGTSDISAGDTLTYTITATNTGAATLTNLTVSDPMLTPDTNNCNSVSSGGTCVLTGTYTVTAADVSNGTIVNTASSQSDQTAPINDTETVVLPNPGLIIAKPDPVNSDEDGSGDISAGDTLSYTITATNNGTAVLTNVTVTDNQITPATQACAQVAPGATCVLTGTYTVTAADVTNSRVDNTATATADQTGPVEADNTVNLLVPALALDKSVPANADEDGSGDLSVGDTLTYTITATNNGSATLTNVVVNDPLITPDTSTCASVAASATCVLTGTYTITSADVANGQIDNTATADSDQTAQVDDSQTVTVLTPQLALSKPTPANGDQDGSGDISAGDILTYTITATNSGATSLTNVIVDDAMLAPSSATCAQVSPGDTCVLTGTYTVTAADVATGVVDNTATAVSDQTPSVDDQQSVALGVPSHLLDKTAPANADEDGSGDISVGDTLTYTITATNNGAANLTNMVISDPMLTPDSITCAAVAVGNTCVLTGSYIVVAADVANGSIVNTATSNTDQTGSQTDTETVTLNTPALALDKAAPVNADEDGSGDISVGDTLTYTITASNSGTAALTNVIVNDTMLTPDSASCAVVAAAAPGTGGGTCVLTGTYVVTSADLATGSITNTASADSDQTSAISDTEIVTLLTPFHILDKAAPTNADEDGSTDISVGDTLTYTITATNNGSATLTNLVVSDPMLTPDAITCATVAAGDTCVLTGSYSVTSADVSAGTINNTAISVSDQTGQIDDTETVAVPSPAMTLNKPAPANADQDSSGDVSAGDVLTYTITATNSGTAVLTGVQINDPLLTPSAHTCATVAPGDSCVLSGSYTVTSADVANGTIDNTATAQSLQTSTIDDSHTLPLAQPTLALVKDAPVSTDNDGTGDISAGDTLTYTVTATNSGAATLTNVVVSDPMLTPNTITCATLAAGEQCVLSGSYNVTAADVTATRIDNTATADSDQTTTVTDNKSVTVPAPLHTLDKSVPANADNDNSGDTSVSDVLTYTITATNTGTATLTNLTINDSMITPSSTTCATVAPAATCVLSGTYVVTATDITNGAITNTATSVSDQTPAVDDTQTISLNAPGLAIDKSTPLNSDEDGSGDISVGDTLTYTITATNTGSSNLTNVVVNDPLITPSTQNCASLAIGADCVLTGSYVVTSSDVSTGVINNTASADSVQTAAVSDSESVPVPSPQLTLSKPAPINSDQDSSGDISAGDVLAYTITATNSGTATLTDVIVDDGLITPSSASCSVLIPGDTCVLTGTYTVTVADVAAAVVDNTATAVSQQTAIVSDSASVPLASPALGLTKSAPTNADEDGSSDVSAGDTLTYTVTATNNGTATLTNVTVSDPLLTPANHNCANLLSGDTCVLTGTYVVTDANVAAGTIDNTASANSDQTGSADASHSLPLPQPTLALDKSTPVNADEDGSGDISVGDTLTYTVTATNSGTSTLTNVVVDDPLLTPSNNACATLAADDTCVLTGIYSVTAADVSAGAINNTATADSQQTPIIDDSETVLVPSPLHTLVKSAPSNADDDGSGDISAGDVLTYTITATNTGSATLTNLRIDDAMLNPATATCALVTVGNTCVLTGTYTVTATDIGNGNIINTATSISDQSGAVDDSQTIALNAPSLALDKPAPVNTDEDGSTDISVGDTLTYTITATNNGSSNLTNVVVSDPLITPDTQTCASVATGGTCVLIGTYTATGDDITAGVIDNTATAGSDQTAAITDNQSVPVPTPQLTLNKPAPVNDDRDGSSDISAGDVLTYTITATNSGTATLTNVVVDDPLINPSSATCASVPGGATCVLSGNYTVTTADVAAGQIDNTASANSDQTGAVQDSQTVSLSQPQLSLVKASPVNADEDGSGDISTGDTLSYTITATNNGAAILTNVIVSDPLINPTTVTCATLSPGADCVLNGSYVTTAADVAGGIIDNTATASSDQTPAITDEHNLVLPQPALSLVKSAPANTDNDGSADISAGDTLTYTITATNSGSSTLTNVVVSDPMISPETITCATLTSGDSCVLTGDYTVDANDVTVGVINNTAEAQSVQTAAITDSESVVVPAPSHTLAKAIPVNADDDGSGDISAGDVLTYTVTATNVGTANLTNLVVTDALIAPDTQTCAFIAAGETCVLVGTYTVTTADIAAGIIDNNATAVSDQSAQTNATQSVNLNAPSLALDKSAPVNADEDNSTDLSVGDTLTYTVTATNSGMAILTNVKVYDPLLSPATQSCDSVSPGDTCVLTGTYTVTADDVTAGLIDNIATADSDQTDELTDAVSVPVPTPALALQKAIPINGDQDGSGDISDGDELSYTITASNTGTAFLTNVVINDPLTIPDSTTCELLAPGATCVHSGIYTVSKADVDNGLIENTATATADQHQSVSDSQSTALLQPQLQLTKSAPINTDNDGSGDLSAGDTLSYTVAATNTGTATLTYVTVDDPLLTPASITCNTVAPGDTCELTGTLEITTENIVAGSIVNSATAEADQTNAVVAEQTTLLPAPSLVLNKSVPVNNDADSSGDLSAGDTLTYTAIATNNGSSNLTGVTVVDALISPNSVSCSQLAPGESCILTGSYTLTANDVAAGEIVNTASARSDQTPAVDDTQTQNLTGPALSLDKTLSSNADEDGSGDVSTGDTLSYTIVASNSGNANLTNVLVSDPMLTPSTQACDTLLPGQTCTLTGAYIVTASDVANGAIDNTATAESDQTPSINDSETVLVPTPSYTLTKALAVNADEDGSGDISAGDTLTYTVTAGNNGTATLTNVSINDALLSPTSQNCSTLSVADQCVLTGTYTVTTADVLNGVIDNTATVSSDQLASLSDTLSIALNAPTLSLEKVLSSNADEDGSNDISQSDTLTYTVTAINSGASALTNVLIADPMIAPDTQTCALLPVGASCVLSGTYQVSADDVAAAVITNTATADSDQTDPLSASVTETLGQPALTLEKTLASAEDTDNTGGITVDDTLHYSVIATNTGTATLTNVMVVDPLLAPNAANCAILLPQASCQLTGYYIVTDDDVSAAQIVNTASVSSDQTPSADTSHTVDIAQPLLTLVKAEPLNADNDGSGSVTIGDVLTYTVTATNTGAESLSSVVVSDPMITPDSITCALLTAADTCVLTGTYTVAANDAGNGEIINVATVSSDQTPTMEASHTLPVITILPPVTNDNSRSDLPLGQSVTIAVLADDTDPESNIDPTTVQLIDPTTDEPITELTVDGEGRWEVDANSGDITFTPAPGFVGSPKPVQYVVSDTTGLTSNRSVVTLSFEQPASLTGTVWLDIDRDGEIDATEPVKPGWTLNIYDDAGELVATTITDDNGTYAVDGLIPSEYTVHFLNEAGVFMAEATTGGVLQAGQTINLPLPIDPSGVVYDSVTREPIPNVTLQLVNSTGVVIDPVCLNANQQGQTTQADGYYAFDVFPEAHPSCPLDDVYRIEIVSHPPTYQGLSTYLLAENDTFDSDTTEAGCTVDSIPSSGACEVQPQAVAPQAGEDTTFYLAFRLAAGDTNVIFNHIPLDPTLAAALADMTVQKTAARQRVSSGDVLYYTVRVQNTQDNAVNNVVVTDDLPNGFTLVPASAVVTTYDADQNAQSSTRPTVTGADPIRFTGLTVPGRQDGDIAITYAVRVGASLVQGRYTNVAEVTDGGSSNTARATVDVIADPVLDNATLVGKVFHDRDADGYQDSADATRITLTTASDYFGDHAYRVGDLDGRYNAAESPAAIVVKIPFTADNRFVIRSSEGSILTADNSLQITESHVGQRARGITAQDLRVTTRVTQTVPTLAHKDHKAVLTKVLEITISNHGIHEEGLPGVRLATVRGLVIETDKAGRFHIPDVDTGTDGTGRQTIVKLDTATLPRDAQLTTENPRVLRITNGGLNTMRFGVQLPVKDPAPVTGVHTKRAVEVKLGSVFFDTDKHNIRADQRGAIADIIKHLKAYGSGRILIQAHTDARNSRAYNIALAKRRARTVERELRSALGSSLLKNVTVDVDTSAYRGGTDKTIQSTDNRELGQ
jgi:uncharacterized repeat protein (TIGR01451 family)